MDVILAIYLLFQTSVQRTPEQTPKGAPFPTSGI